jgi:pimeloyl-ACP methyl ester carboxylesterase
MTGSPQLQDKKKPTNLAPVVGATSLVALIGIVLATAAYIRRYVLHNLPMTAALSGELRDYYGVAGRLAYYTASPAKHSSITAGARAVPPLLFIHSINAAPSSYEMKPLYEHYAHERSVYSLDLPGFGFSERTDREYSPRLYRDAINDFIAKELKSGPVDVVSMSLSSEFVALAAQAKPNHFRTMTFISPTGMSYADPQVKPNPMLLRFFLMPQWSRGIFDIITSRPSIRFFTSLSRSQGYDRGFSNYAYVTSHQPKAQYAPYYFLAGMLFTRRIFDVYTSLKQNVLVTYGQSATTRLQRLNELSQKPNWRIAEFVNSRDLVQYDDIKGLIQEIDQLLARPE